MPINGNSRIKINKDFKPETLEDLFLSIRANLIDGLRNELIKAGKDQPGSLLQSVDGDVVSEPNKIVLEIDMNKYWRFVNDGVDGTAKSVGSQYKFKKKNLPRAAMLQFIKVRGIKPNSTKKIEASKKKINKVRKKIVKQNNLNELAFLFGRKIAKYGIEPTHFYDNVINDSFKKELTTMVSKALKQDILIDFKSSFE